MQSLASLVEFISQMQLIDDNVHMKHVLPNEYTYGN